MSDNLIVVSWADLMGLLKRGYLVTNARDIYGNLIVLKVSRDDLAFTRQVYVRMMTKAA